jgi:hypothetical protein
MPVRPVQPRGSYRRCPQGHDLAIAGALSGYSHRYQLTDVTCTACKDLGDPRASWCEIDPADQHQADDAPGSGLVLVRIPPAVRGGVGQLQLRLDGVVLGDLDLAVCGPCRRAVLEHIRVDTPRRSYGRVLVAAALALAPPAEYSWSTTKVSKDDPIARAFWAGIGWPGSLGEPAYCTDMERAAGRLPDW